MYVLNIIFFYWLLDNMFVFSFSVIVYQNDVDEVLPVFVLENKSMIEIVYINQNLMKQFHVMMNVIHHIGKQIYGNQ